MIVNEKKAEQKYICNKLIIIHILQKRNRSTFIVTSISNRIVCLHECHFINQDKV